MCFPQRFHHASHPLQRISDTPRLISTTAVLAGLLGEARINHRLHPALLKLNLTTSGFADVRISGRCGPKRPGAARDEGTVLVEGFRV